MFKHNLNDLIEFDNRKFNSKVLINDPDYRLVLLGIKAGQSVPEHTTSGRLTVYAVFGRITFYERDVPCELHRGEVVSIAAGMKHHIDAHEDSTLLVLATGAVRREHAELEEEIDIRSVPRPQRHPLIFAKFDLLPVGGSFRLLNDHDPVPLSQQFESLRHGQAAWEYLERGPNIFRIKITRISPRNTWDTLPEDRISPASIQDRTA